MANASTEIIAPKMIVIPIISGSTIAQHQISGALYLSGAKLYYWMGVPKLVSSQ